MNDHHNKLKASTRPVHLTGAAVCLAIVGAAGGLFFIPTVRAAKASGAAAQELVEVSQTLEQSATMNRTLTAQVAQLEASLESRDITLTGIDDLNRRLAELTALCVSHGLTPEAIQPREVVAGSVTPIVPIRFEVLGSLGAVDNLLGVFDEQFPDLHIHQLTIEHTAPETVRLRCVLSWLTKPKP